MYHKSKYIIVRQGNLELPFVFSELSVHAEIARAVGGVVVGAGFCFIDEDCRYVCHGESVSCKVESRGKVDEEVLNRLLGSVSSL